MAAVALTSAGLVVGGVVVVGQLASADDPTLAPAAAGPQPGDEEVGTPPDTTAPTTVPTDAGDGDDDRDTGRPVLDGQIVIDIGDGDPITIDLGEIGDCIDLPILDSGNLIPAFPEIEAAPTDVPGPRGGHVVVAGPDGVQVIEFGEGDGSVTITKSGDEITVDAEGDAQIDQPGEVFQHVFPDLGEMPDISVPMLPDLSELQDCLADAES